MKIEPIRHTSTPEYLQKLTAILTAAGMLTGCTGCSFIEELQLDGGVEMFTEPTTTEELQLAGEVEAFTDPTEPDESAVDFKVTEEELQLMGDVAMFTDPSANELYNEDLIYIFEENQITMQPSGNTESYENFIVEIALFSDTQKLAVCYYQNESYNESLIERLAERAEQGEAEAFGYGYIDQMEVSGTTCRVIFFNVTEPLTADDLNAIAADLDARGIL